MSVIPLGDELAPLSGTMSPMLRSANSVAAAINVLTSLAEETVPGATGAGVSLFEDQGRRTSTAATTQLTFRSRASDTPREQRRAEVDAAVKEARRGVARLTAASAGSAGARLAGLGEDGAGSMRCPLMFINDLRNPP